MKSLKFKPELIEAIQKGEYTSTWRLFDDKDLSVGEKVQFIDSNSGAVFGYGLIEEIISKRISKINKSDMAGHEYYDSVDILIDVFTKYYGNRVKPESIVKIIKFDYMGTDQDDLKTSLKKVNAVKLYADGGSRGNPGPSASGYVILDLDDKMLITGGEYLGITTNNQAEYQAVKMGLIDAGKMGAKIVHVYLDSLLIVNQMTGIFKVRNRELWPIHSTIKDKLNDFEKVSFIHVPREMNKLADAKVNEILDNYSSSGLQSELL